MPLDAVFFDLDGTLLDTSADLGNALNKTLQQHGYQPLPLSEIRQHVSNGAAALIKLGFGKHLEHEQTINLRGDLLKHYFESIAVQTTAFAGIENLIAQLNQNGIAWGIVTNKPQRYTEALMKHFTFASAPCATISPEHAGIGKPDPAPLLYACEHARVRPENCLYIGDHLRDIECGRNAGMPTVAVGYGFTIAPDDYLSWEADHTAALAQDIWPIIQKHFL